MTLPSFVRGVSRLAAVGCHLMGALVVAGLVFPWVGQPRRLMLKRLWSRTLLVLLGVELRRFKEGSAEAALIVANHTSWLDIFAINAIAPAGFVCKADVRDWLLIGWLCSRTDTFFLERGSGRAARLAAERLREALRRGQRVAVFPEGTSSDGGGVLPFRAALLQAAIDAPSRLQPIALRYTDREGRRSCAAAYHGDMSLWRSLLQICFGAPLSAEVHMLSAIDPAGRTRRQLAAVARVQIAACLSGADRRRCALDRFERDENSIIAAGGEI